MANIGRGFANLWDDNTQLLAIPTQTQQIDSTSKICSKMTTPGKPRMVTYLRLFILVQVVYAQIKVDHRHMHKSKQILICTKLSKSSNAQITVDQHHMHKAM